MAQLRAAAKELVDACLSQQVKFPKRWKRPKINQACRATLVYILSPFIFIKRTYVEQHYYGSQMLNNTDTGFDQRAALDYMKLKYGTGNGPTTDKKPQKKRQKKAVESTEKLPAKEGEGEIDGTPPKRRRRGSHGGGGNDETSPDFHPKKYEIVEVEDNRPLVEAIKELGALHYRANEPKKGSKLL